ncbi:MAG TPA: hypothetical protein VI389_04590 [Geobacteraceae bacterium]
MARSLTILIGVFFSLSLLASAFHHHADLNDQPTCVFCKAAKDLASSDHVPTPPLETPLPQVTLQVPAIVDEPGRLFVPPSNDRAPPCFL